MFALAWKELSRRPGRAVLSVLGFMLVAWLVAAAMCIGRAVREAASEPLRVAGADLIVYRKSAPCAFAPVKLPKDLGAMTMEDVARIRALKGVRSASGALVVWAFEKGQPTVVTGVVPGSVKAGPLRQYRSGERCCVLEEGRLFEPTERDVTIVDRAFADQRGLKLNSMVRLGPREFKVVGILKVAGVAVIGGGQAYVPLATAQEMLEQGPIVVYAFVTTDADADADADATRLGDEIRAIVGEGCQVATQESLPGEISRAVAITAGSTLVFVLLILISGGLLIIRAVLSSVRERVVEIGILKAIGWRRRDVVRLIGLETLMQGALGALPGTVLGYVTAFVACRHLNLKLPGAFNSYPACATTAPASELMLTPTVGPVGVIAVLVLTVLLALVAGVIAGRVVASRAPMESLRQA
ncbi:MAG: hypothetical protein A3K19_03890 [Lentisphaerae bacterium RIFOXYB12_FULL_65_16]|nr:MAG: hypothetical protein A3K18_02975 [Lentisphaerae bacterium RIFOXYA12_64_32]OGV89285.1 MAG: hypothetical protein A3K19_03890 [Lentisphaerae bacterium RIFOXYB12_FULL_65_16]